LPLIFYQPKILLATKFPSIESPCQNDLFPRKERKKEKTGKKSIIFGTPTPHVVSISSNFDFAKKKEALNQTIFLMTNSYISI
jgi:hypothetical protein